MSLVIDGNYIPFLAEPLEKDSSLTFESLITPSEIKREGILRSNCYVFISKKLSL